MSVFRNHLTFVRVSWHLSVQLLAFSPALLIWAPLVSFLLHCLLLFAMFSEVLFRGWCHLLLQTLSHLLAYVRWPVALRHALRPWGVESWGVRRTAPG